MSTGESAGLGAGTGRGTVTDPYQARSDATPRRFLYGLNPLATLAAVLPVIVAALFTRNVATPFALTVLGVVILLVGVRLSLKALILLLVALPAFVCVLTVSFGVWTDPAMVADTPVVVRLGGFQLYAGALEVGLATALRLAVLIVLALACSLATQGADFVRSAVRYLRVPYRIGYTVLAAYRFVPRFGRELEVIRQAHRVRGSAGGRGPIGAIRRGFGSVVPLLAAAIRHAERVALAMDARAFGAYPTRTERHEVPLRLCDGVAIAVFWLVAAGIFVLTADLR
ncbi:energy-coupling factor transporter transmembrane component T [Rathayibacter soli]|uniref:energy-coupling factor transporter transmembrane component T n=1 Tax=Rathayibacter soli TaxID=3144168 RepID=UPI0027E48B27|nr:energy-coupling factor transporter transmembrane component T [Glaciibacter superstes]